MLGVVSAYLFLVVFIGPEHHSTHFEEGKLAIEEGGGCQMADDLGPALAAEHSDSVQDSEEKGGDPSERAQTKQV